MGLFYTGEPYNSYWLLNLKRAKYCIEAWLSVDGDCSTGEERVRLGSWEDAKALKFRTIPYLEGDGVFPAAGGYTHHSAEFVGDCFNNDYRFLSLRDGLGIASTQAYNEENFLLNFAFLSDPVVPGEQSVTTCPDNYNATTCQCECPDSPPQGVTCTAS